MKQTIRAGLFFMKKSYLSNRNRSTMQQYMEDNTTVIQRYKCCVCSRLRTPIIQTICGHLCCLVCFIDKTSQDGGFVCPKDGTTVKRKEQYFLDRFVERILNENVQCVNKKFGCRWRGRLKNTEEHMAECPYFEVRNILSLFCRA